MSRTKAYVVLTSLLLSACATAPDAANEAPAAALVAAAADTPATSTGAIVPNAVVDANELIASTPPKPVCRDMLRPNSNVLVKTCMREEDWKRYDQMEAQRAAELTRMMQGGRYR